MTRWELQRDRRNQIRTLAILAGLLAIIAGLYLLLAWWLP